MHETGFGLNPMELNDLYEYLWNMGVKMQSENAMGFFEAAYRPWPKLHEDDAVSATF